MGLFIDDGFTKQHTFPADEKNGIPEVFIEYRPATDHEPARVIQFPESGPALLQEKLVTLRVGGESKKYIAGKSRMHSKYFEAILSLICGWADGGEKLETGLKNSSTG